jgi:exopolysaccharide production protein ExoZ
VADILRAPQPESARMPPPATTRRSPTPAKLDNLQMLRALAAFSIVVLHAFHETENLAGSAGGQPVSLPDSNLAFGVDIFFVLSGFIMAHTTASEFGKEGAPLRFFRRRCARVVPLYWLLTTVMLIGAAIAPTLLNVPVGSLYHVIASYLFVPDARGVGEVRPVMALGWTLNYEMLFYVMFSIALMTPIRFGVAWLSCLMAMLAVTHVFLDPSHVPAVFWTDPLILEFLFGVYVALIYREGWRLSAGTALLISAIGLIGFLRLSTPWDDAALPVFLRSGAPAALMVFAAALGPSAPITRLTTSIVLLGDASYSLYLVHPFVLRPARAIWVRAIGGHMPVWLFVPVAVAACVVVAVIVYRRVERPLTVLAQALNRRAEASRLRPLRAP